MTRHQVIENVWFAESAVCEKSTRTRSCRRTGYADSN